MAAETRDAKKPRVNLPKRVRKRTERPAAPEEVEPEDGDDGDGRKDGKRSRSSLDLFANPSSEESAALSWLREHLDEERAKEISKQIRALSAPLMLSGRRSLARSQGITIGRQEYKHVSTFMPVVRQQVLQGILQERGRQTSFAGFRRDLGPSAASSAMDATFTAP